MSRIKITISGKAVAEFSMHLRISDINYGNHLGHDALISILHDCRVQWLQQMEYAELDVEGIGLIMADLAIEYRSEAHYGDILVVTISFHESGKYGFDLYYEVKNQHGTLVARAKTGMVCYDYTLKKIAALPEQLLKKI